MEIMIEKNIQIVFFKNDVFLVFDNRNPYICIVN